MLKVNDYFSGKVKSIGFDAASTGRASVGVMEAGEHTFTTGQPEVMTVTSGAHSRCCRLALTPAARTSGAAAWRRVTA